MEKNIIFIGVDVDDKSFHGCAYRNGVVIGEFKCRPNVGHLVKQLKNFQESGFEVRVCYEATYLGFTLCRKLRENGYHCDVIAPSLIPQQPGWQQKTDKIDSRKLAEYYGNGQLTIVTVPDEKNERARDLVRSRNFMMHQLKALKLHILSQCRRSGMSYREEAEVGEGKEQKRHWTKHHREWLNAIFKKQEDKNLVMNLNLLLEQEKRLSELVKSYDDQIEMISKQEEYKKKVSALCCYRGIDTLSAMTVITEIGDIKRFGHPRKLAGYAGLDLREYSSGGKERRYGITKMGNRHIRTSVIEACQMASRYPQTSRRLKNQRETVDKKYVEIADRCMRRLHKKSRMLLTRDKAKNKVKVACAREMLCFIWESLKEAA